MSVWVCKYCIMGRGIRGSELTSWPAMDDHEAQYQHIESEHHIPVRREGETVEQAKERFARNNPECWRGRL